jgi:hypothetical protein
MCQLFSHSIFFLQAAANREGTEKDKEALTKIFEEFGFEVEPHDNLKANEITEKMNQLAIRDYKNYGCVVVCMLSHGDEGTICGSDFYYDSKKKKKFNEVSIEDTKKEFYRNDSLKDKLKIRIIQACQGSQLQEDFEIKKIIETREGNIRHSNRFGRFSRGTNLS